MKYFLQKLQKTVRFLAIFSWLLSIINTGDKQLARTRGVPHVGAAQSDFTRNDADVLTHVIGARVRANGGGGGKQKIKEKNTEKDIKE